MQILTLPVVVYKYADHYEAHASVPQPHAPPLAEMATGQTKEEAMAALRRKVVLQLESDLQVEEVTYEPLYSPIGVVRQGPALDKVRVNFMNAYPALAEAQQACVLLALQPLAAIADAYDDNALDEARPEWVQAGRETYDPNVGLYFGRGGKTLLTLQHAKEARDVLKRAPSASTGISKQIVVLRGIANCLARWDANKLNDVETVRAIKELMASIKE